MKKLRLALFAFALSMLILTGCSENNTPSKGTALTPEASASESDVIHSGASGNSADDEFPPEEGMVRSKVTNEWVNNVTAEQRLLAVMIPNESAAVPHYGISEASVLYEANVEGGLTRMLAIFEDYTSIKKLGNIRSLRDYYVYWALEWDAVICHFGQAYYADTILAELTTDHLDGNVMTEPFFRSSDRNTPHNAYMDSSLVKSVMGNRNISLERRTLADENHYIFANHNTPNTLSQYNDAEDATYVDMSACYPLTKCYFEYNEENGLYYRSQHLAGNSDGPHIDGANGKQLTFSNIIIQSCDYSVRDQSGYLLFNTIDSGRDAWYITQGKLIKCFWKKETEFGATRYYDKAGNEITFNTGKTMVLIIKEGDTFDYK